MTPLQRIKVEIARLFRFGLVGVAATATYWLVTVALARYVKMEAVYASFLGVAFSAPVSYFGHQLFSFRVQPDHERHLIRFVAILGITLGINLMLVWMIGDVLGFATTTAATVVAIVIPCINYLMNKYFVFQPSFGQT